MAKLPNKLVIEITDTNKFDELGNPVIGFESKDYAEYVIEELEKLKAEFEEDKYILLNQITAIKVIDKRIKELKGENNA